MYLFTYLRGMCLLGMLGSTLMAQVTLGDSTLRDADGKADLEYTAHIDTAFQAAEQPTLHVGGALRFNYQYRNWSAAHARQGGAFTFDTWRLNVDGQARGVLLSLEYRFYSGFHLFHHGWFGYDLSPRSQVQLGITQVPFGLLPYASHSWWFQTAYYLGLEDDYDLGLKYRYQGERWTLHLAYFKNAEPTLSGSSLASARYSYDVVPARIMDDSTPIAFTPGTPGPDVDSIAFPSRGPDTTLYSANEEVNQFNLRATYQPTESLELGLSLQGSGIYNQDLGQTGLHRALAAHLRYRPGHWDLMAAYIYYDYELPVAPGQDSERLVMGAYDFPYYVATQGQLFMAGISYTLPVDWGPIQSLTFYDNYTYFDKGNPNFSDTQQHVIGCLVGAGQLFTYVDVASGRNHPWLGPFESHWTHALAAGASNPGANQWHTRVNLNFGYYF